VNNRLAKSGAPPSPRPVEQVRAAENFPVALRVLPARLRGHLHALYGYARYVDDLGDEPVAPGVDRLAALDAFEAELRDLYAGRLIHHPVLRGLAPTVVECRLPMEPLSRLIEANRVDQRVTRYATFAELLDYCKLSANPVGELVLRVFRQADAQSIAWSDQICTALQIVEHLQDIGEDHERGRIYLPTEELTRFGVAEAELAAATASPGLRSLVRMQAQRARLQIEAGRPLIGALHGWARVAVAGYLAGGLATLDALARADHDPLRRPVRPTRRRVLTHCAAAIGRRRR